jgi:hypothetical protein
MAVDYKPLNRNQEFSTPQKAAIKKIFGFAEVAAAAAPDASAISRTIVHTVMSGHFSANADRDIRALFKEFRSAIAAQDSSRDLDSTFGGMCMEGTQRRLLKTMANAVVAQIV